MANDTIISASFNYMNSLFSGFMLNLIAALIILLIGFILGRAARKMVKRGLAEIELDKLVKSAVNIRFSLESVLSRFVGYIIYFIAIVMSLNKIGLTTTILHLLSAAVVVLIVISIFLGIKDYIPNAISGIMIHQKRIVEEGDMIKVKGMEGRVVHVNLVETRIETKSKDLIFIPNSTLTKTEVIKLKDASKKKARSRVKR